MEDDDDLADELANLNFN